MAAPPARRAAFPKLMNTSLTVPRLAAYISRQMNSFFPDDDEVVPERLEPLVEQAVRELDAGLAVFHNAYFWRDGSIYLNHLHGDQYILILYRLGHLAAKAGPAMRGVMDKAYLLNKALHGLDLYPQVELPAACWLAHPVGTVIGRAKYHGPLMVMQGCTIGNRGGDYPVIGRHVVLCAHTTLLGACEIGDNVCFGAGSMVLDEKIPSDTTVVGRSPNLRIIPRRANLISRVFRDVVETR